MMTTSGFWSLRKKYCLKFTVFFSGAEGAVEVSFEALGVECVGGAGLEKTTDRGDMMLIKESDVSDLCENGAGCWIIAANSRPGNSYSLVLIAYS